MSTTFTTSSRTHSIRPEIRFEIDYLRTFHGVLKGIVIVLGIINLIIIALAPWYGVNGFFNSTVWLAFWYSLIMLGLFLFHIPEKFYTLPWLPIEIGAICIITLLYFIASLMVLLVSSATHTVAGIFGFITTAVYAYSGYLKFQAWKNGELAQGSLTNSTTSTVTQSSPSAFPA
jgi:hypothetical protein